MMYLISKNVELKLHVGNSIPEEFTTTNYVKGQANRPLVVQADGDELEKCQRILGGANIPSGNRVFRFVGNEAWKVVLNWDNVK